MSRINSQTKQKLKEIIFDHIDKELEKLEIDTYNEIGIYKIKSCISNSLDILYYQKFIKSYKINVKTTLDLINGYEVVFNITCVMDPLSYEEIHLSYKYIFGN